MKILKRIILAVAVLFAAAFVTLIVWGGGVIKHGVNTVGPQLLGVPVKLEHATFRPLRGHVSLRGLLVGNPEGFNTESLFEISNLEVNLDTRSLFTDTIIIDRIVIDAPQITYEVGLRRTNIGALLEQLEGEAKKADSDGKPSDESGKQVVIRELVVVDARAQVSATALRGRVVPIQLSTITLNNLGGEDQSITQITTEVVKAIFGAVGNAVAGAGDLLGNGLKSALDGVGTLGGVAAEGIRGAAGMAEDGARAVTGTLSEGARGIRGLLPGGAKEDADTLHERDAPAP